MSRDLYESVVSKIATVVPMFGKSIVDSALAGAGYSPSTVTPAQMLVLIRDEIGPRLRKFTSRDDEVMALGAGIVATDGDGRVILMDTMARILLGFPPDTVEGDDLITDHLAELEVLPGESSRPRVTEFHHEPSQRHLNVAVAPRHDRHGRPSGSVVIIQDVTLRVALEQEVQRYEERLARATRELEERNRELVAKQAALDEKNRQLEEANRHKSEFLSRMSHELRTPLHCIIGYSQLAMERGTHGEDPETLESLNTSVTCAYDLLAIINDVLDLTRAETGGLSAKVEDVDVRLLVRESVETVRPLVADRAVRLGVTVPDERVILSTDRLRLKQVLLNLLGNAVKFTDEGEVEVVLEVPAGGGVCVSVRDTGIGMTEDEQRHIFEDFYQADGSATRRHGGTGIGLALVRHMLQVLGGEIEVESAPGKGSTFTVSLPDGMEPVGLRPRDVPERP